MKKIKKISVFLFLFVIINIMFSKMVFAESNQEIDLYYIDEKYQEYLTKPDDFPSSKKIDIENTSGNVSYKLIEGKTAEVSSDGIVSVKGKTMYCVDNFCSSSPISGATEKTTYEEGVNKIEVTTDTGSFVVTVNVNSYARYNAEKIMDDYIEENITDSMTEKEKMKKFLELLSQTRYSVESTSYVGLFSGSGGDCIASASAIVYFANKVGIKAHIRYAVNDATSAGNNHHNAAAILDGKLYVIEASYREEPPRSSTITLADNGFVSAIKNSKYVFIQYDGYDEVAYIPEFDFITILGSRAFMNGKHDETVVTTVHVPKTITSIEPLAFNGLSTLNNIIVDEDNPNYMSLDNILYSKDGKTIYSYPSGRTASSYTINNNVTTIGDYAFSYNSNLKNIVIPDSVTTIGKSAFYGNDFEGVVLPESVSNIGDAAFDKAVVENSTNGLHYVVVKNKNATLGKSLCTVITPMYGYAGSTAETYAEENGCFFGEIKEDQTEFKLINNLDISISSAEFDEEETIKPEIIIKDGDYVLQEGIDYVVKLKDVDNPYQMGRADINGIGNYVGFIDKSYDVTPKQIKYEYINPVVDYTGEIQSPIIEAEEGATVYYGNNSTSGLSTALREYKEPGTYTFGARIVKDNYDTVYLNNLTFTINYLDFTKVVVEDMPDYIYTGTPFFPNPKVTYDGKILEKGTDYTLNISSPFGPGVINVELTGKGIYSGTITKTYNIYGYNQFSVMMDKNNYSVTLNSTSQASLHTDPETEIMTYLIKWSSKDTSIATIDENGIITGKSIGTTTITGTYGRQTVSATVNVSDYIKGDMNMNGRLEAVDFILGLEYYIGKYNPARDLSSVYDMNGNGMMEAVDAILIYREYMKL